MTKAMRELKALRRVYKPTEFPVLEHSDRPDFLLRRHGDGEPFGVEVTDLYRSEIHARLYAIPDYISHLLSGGPPAHKDDAALLHEVEIYSPDGKSKGRTRALFAGETTAEAYLDRIRARVELKAKKVAGYRTDLTHVNLLINDEWRELQKLNLGQVVGRVLTPALLATLWSSPFREVTLLTSVAGPERCALPLMQLGLMRSWIVFGEVIKELGLTDVIRDEGEYFNLLAEFLVRKGIPAKRTAEPFDSPQVVCANCGIGYRDDSMAVFELAELPPPTSLATAPWESLTSIRWEDVSECATRLEATRVFGVAYAIPVSDP